MSIVQPNKEIIPKRVEESLKPETNNRTQSCSPALRTNSVESNQETANNQHHQKDF